jgi:hypothetical protein
MIDLNHSRKLATRPRASCFLALFLLAGWPAMSVSQAAALAATNTPAAIPWNQIGAKAGANYQGDGLAVTPTGSGARLHCIFQRLDGEATPEGLWLTSTVTNTVNDRFRVTAIGMGRTTADATFNSQYPESRIPLAGAGGVSLFGQTVRLSRLGLTEEYSVSMDGVRQDFIVEQAPASPPVGELVVKLAVAGAEVQPATDGARLVLDHSGRKIAYSRLRVTDATGKELPARIEVASAGDEATGLNSWIVGDNQELGLLMPAPAREELAVVVNDTEAVYPVRIDPTFSDANWVSMGGFPGANNPVSAAVIDGSGNLYIGGTFTVVGNIFANNVAEWNGSSWSALGSGVDSDVYALAESGGILYVGGDFSTAGGIPANYIAEWNGSSWSALGSGMDSDVYALAVSGGTLYAGGQFMSAGGIPANYIAEWNGSSWSALGSGMDSDVYALAVSGGTLYAGGQFMSAGGIPANYVAEWNGSSWSPFGSGVDSDVYALAVSGGTLYAGGDVDFSTAGGIPANSIAQWNGSSWSALGSGVSGDVEALAVSGYTLYAGGQFTSVGGIRANNIAQWNGSSWSPLGSWIGGGDGYGPQVYALAVSRGTLYSGGQFTSAGGIPANNIAQWNGSGWSPLGSWIAGSDGYGPQVSAVAVSGGTLYAGGQFTSAGGIPANNIAQWNGSSWSPLGSGMSGAADVLALAVSGSTLYAGGVLTTAGGSPAVYIAQWNGSSWSSLGSGLASPGSSIVNALVSDEAGNIYAGGLFETAGGTAASSIARWNGTSWSALGSGVNDDVYALAVSGSTLYAGGAFTSAGGSAVNYIAQWNGSTWSALGSGMSGSEPFVVCAGGVGQHVVCGRQFHDGGRQRGQ